MSEPQTPEVPVIDFSTLKVEIDGLDDFVRTLQAEIDQNLQPSSGQITADHYESLLVAQNGRGVSLEGLHRDYYQAQSSANQGLASYVEAAQVLVRAVELMAGFYRGADGMSQARAINVAGAISAAQAEVDTTRRAEEHREDAGLNRP